MRFLRRTLIGLFLLFTTLGLLAYAGNSVYSTMQARLAEEPQQRPQRERVFAVNVVAFEPTTVTPVLETFGELRSRRELDVRAATGGEVVWLSEAFEEGGRVEAGDLLLKIDPANAQADLDTARTDLAEAEAEVRDARRNLELAQDEVAAAEDQLGLRERALQRQRDLLERGVGTDAAVETAALAASSARQALIGQRTGLAQDEARVDQAENAVSRRQIVLNEAERTLADTEIHAEFGGVLSEVAAIQGGLVSANERLGQLIDPDRLEVSFRVSTPQYARLLSTEGRLTGAPVTVRLDILGVDLAAQGIVTRESAAVGEGQTGRLLFASLENTSGFRPGDFVTVSIEEPDLDRVAIIPATALDAANSVLIVNDDERLEVADVDLLRRQGDNVIVRARGLAGQQIVAERTPLLGAGIRVRAVTPEAAAAPPEAPAMVSLDEEQKARLIAFVENGRMPDAVKQRLLGQLEETEVPAQLVERLEGRMGG
ncbi:MAG: HlyD family efflux transporter periplasmic adaptor subunit [Pseudomonadota bacterium]